MRKFLSVLLAIAMVLSLTVTGFAIEDTAAATDAETKTEATMAGKTVILHTNDVHGAVDGYAYIAQLKADYEAKGAEVILVDAGDYSQGKTYVSVTKGADAVTMMNAAGYDVVTLGNHEFDYGYAQLKENMSKAKFKVVCADVFNENGTPIFDANYTYTTKSGVKVGFFGMETPETQTKANPALIKGLTFATGDAFTKAAADQVAALKDADVVICLAHLGIDAESAPYRSTDLYAAVKGIDFIIDGHSHTVMTKGEKGEPIQSTGTAFANIGVIVIDNATKKLESNSLFEIKEDTAKDATVAAAAQKI
ncbi:MAG: metallophosphatase, partial [Oscillospiraceae bacterium]|nr:metallophosphatase [Oscillospiraceae bacterium]